MNILDNIDYLIFEIELNDKVNRLSDSVSNSDYVNFLGLKLEKGGILAKLALDVDIINTEKNFLSSEDTSFSQIVKDYIKMVISNTVISGAIRILYDTISKSDENVLDAFKQSAITVSATGLIYLICREVLKKIGTPLSYNQLVILLTLVLTTVKTLLKQNQISIILSAILTLTVALNWKELIEKLKKVAS